MDFEIPHFSFAKENYAFKQPVGTGAFVSLYPDEAFLRKDVLSLPATTL